MKYLKNYITFQIILIIFCVFPRSQITWLEYQNKLKEANGDLRKLQKELETQPPKLDISIYLNDREIPARDILFILMIDGEELQPLSVDANIFIFPRKQGKQSVFLKYKSHIFYSDPASYDLLKTGAVIVFQIFTKKSILSVTKKAPTPLKLDENYERITTYHESRECLRGYWLSLPLHVREQVNNVYVLSVSPTTAIYIGVFGTSYDIR